MPWNAWLKRLVEPGIGLALLAAVGCAPDSLREGVPWTTAQYKVADAKTQRVRDWPCVRFDPALESDLDAALSKRDLNAARAEAVDVLDAAHALSLDSTRNELDRLPDGGWRELNVHYFGADRVPDDDDRQRIWKAFVDDTGTRYGMLVDHVRSAETLGELRRHLRRVRAHIEPAVATTGATWRALPWAVFSIPSALAIASIHAKEYRGVLDRPFEHAVRYEPVLDLKDFSFDDPPPSHWDLLRQYAPVIVQEQVPDPPYAPSTDCIGHVVARSNDRIEIDCAVPAVYAYARDVLINGCRHVQLTYTFWYPAHPNLKGGFDPEEGPIEGIVLRVTLDDDHRPALYETLYACGCFHRAYPAQSIEAAARREYGGPERDKALAIERNVTGRIDFIVPKTVPDDAQGRRPSIRCAAAYHAIIDVDCSEARHPNEVRQSYAYDIRPYDELERLPLPDGRITSMFYDNGLVKGAQRVEGVLFTPAGILSAGQPRQRGTQLIHWDHWLLDDPTLFAQALRLPSDF